MKIPSNKIIKLSSELLIVFIGVLLALMGENYMDKVNKISLEKEYLMDLLTELDQSLFVASDDKNRLRILDSAAWTLINLGQGIPNSPIDSSRYQSVCELMGILNGIIEPDIYKSVYEDLKVTGNLQIISNQHLRQRIIKHYERTLYEEQWCREIRNDLAPSFKRWTVDLLTVEEYLAQSACNKKRVLSSLKRSEVINNLKSVRVVAIESEVYFNDRIESIKSLITLIKEELGI